jgi:tetratricopeptide (TPR) repeat protein
MWGNRGLKAWYGGEPFEKALGLGQEDAVRMWRQFIASLHVPDELVAEMKQRYAAPSMFERRCPHAVANLYVRLGACTGSGRTDCGLETFDEIADMDPENPVHILKKIQWLASTCRAGRAHIDELLGNGELLKSQPLKAYALCGDIAWTLGDRKKSLECYDRALGMAYDDYSRRLLSIKVWAAGQEGAIADRYREYLVCDRDKPAASSVERLAVLLAAALEQPDLGLTHYLIARNLLNAGSFEPAAMYLEESLALADLDPGAPLPRLEAMLLLAECLAKVPSRRSEAWALLAQLEAEPGLSPAMTHRMADLREFLQFLESAGEE